MISTYCNDRDQHLNTNHSRISAVSQYDGKVFDSWTLR